MKFINFYKNKWNLIILILSLISLVPCYFFYVNAKQLNDLQDVTNANDALINDTLSRGLSNIHILFPFLIGITVWVINAIISGIAVAKKWVRPSYGFITVFLGGLGIHLVASLIYLIPLRKKDKKSKASKRIWLTTGATLGVTATVVPCAIMIGPKNYESPVIGQPIQMSFSKDNPNLIEVFTDGFDLHDESPLFLNNPEYKEFTYIKHFMTSGHPTHHSMPMVYGSFENNNPFALLDKYKTDATKYADFVYKDGFLSSAVEHFANTSFSSNSIVNPIALSDSIMYGTNVSGVPEAIKKAVPGINITNWSGARDANVSPWGITTKSPDSNSYEWLKNNMVASNQTKGARVLIQDLITHRPFMNADGDRFSILNFSLSTQKQLLNDKLTELIEALKNIKNPNPTTGEAANAYENSMIVVFGDHASHDFIPVGGTADENDARKVESALFIKYPGDVADVTHPERVKTISDRYVWSPQINRIINKYFAPSSDKTNPWDYINKDSVFDNVERPIFGSPTEYKFGIWKTETDANGKQVDKVVPALDANNQVKRVIWSQDPVEQQKQLAELQKVVY